MTQPPISSIPDAPTLDLRIDELMLHGFKPADRYVIASAIERELARLFSAGGVPPALLDREREKGDLQVHQLNAGSFDIPHDAPPAVVGVQVARTIHRGMGGAEASVQTESRSAGATLNPEGVDR